VAVYTHGVTQADIIAQLPAQDKPGAITSTSTGITTGQLDAWILEASASVNATLERYRIDDPATQLTDNAAVVAKTAVVAYALWMVALTSKNSVRAELYKQRWDEALGHLRTTPVDLGSSRQPLANTASNAPRTPSSNQFVGDHWKGW